MCGNLISNVMVFGGGAFGTCWGHEDRTLTNESSDLVKQTPKPSFTPSAWENKAKRQQSVDQAAGRHPTCTLRVP